MLKSALKDWALSISVVINLTFFFYIFAQTTSTNRGFYIFEDLQTSSNVSWNSSWNEFLSTSQKVLDNFTAANTNDSEGESVGEKSQKIGVRILAGVEEFENEDGEKLNRRDVKDERSNRSRALEQLIVCRDRDAEPFTGQRREFWVLYNYVAAERRPHCWESITYTTHADYTFLDNLQPLLERWRGPVSLALYAPGTDFAQTLKTIRYLHKCSSELIRQFVTFHIYFPMYHMPEKIPRGDQILQTYQIDCSLPAPWINHGDTYRKRNNLMYMVNVARNIARETATTHYILASDIELYPSPGLIPKFLDMLLRQDPVLQRKNPRVFVLPIFEVKREMRVPNDKNELMRMLSNGSAITFHKLVCPECHAVPQLNLWIHIPPAADNSLNVFLRTERRGFWEPIYIGTNRDPFYEERLSWEGKGDKMTQGYILCVFNYDLLVLDNAFLVHRPGIKEPSNDTVREKLQHQSIEFISKVIFPELKVLFGWSHKCSVILNSSN